MGVQQVVLRDVIVKPSAELWGIREVPQQPGPAIFAREKDDAAAFMGRRSQQGNLQMSVHVIIGCHDERFDPHAFEFWAEAQDRVSGSPAPWRKRGNHMQHPHRSVMGRVMGHGAVGRNASRIASEN